MKIKNPRLKFMALSLVLFTGLGMSITTIESSEGKAILSAEEYVMEVGQSNETIDLTEEININNKYSSSLIPRIQAGGKNFALSPSSLGEGALIEDEKPSYDASFTAEEADIEIQEEMHLKEKEVELKTTVTNTGDEKAISINYLLRGPKDLEVFYPVNVDNETNNYVVLTDKDHKGLSLGVKTNIGQNSSEEDEFVSKSTHKVENKKRVPSGSSITLRVVLKPLNIWESDSDLPFSEEYTSYLENPLMDPEGELEINVTESNEKIDEILSEVSQENLTGEPEFTRIESPSLSSGNLSSLGATIAFKEACIEEQIPCKIMIGRAGEDKYAWIKAREGEEWIDVNPYIGERKKPGEEYEKIYEEAQPQFVAVEGTQITGEAYLEATLFLSERGGPPILLFIAATAAGIVILFGFLHWRSSWLLKKMSKEEEEIKEKSINGEYIISEEEIENKSAKPVFEKIKEEDGVVKLKRYSEETKYSEEFIKHSITYLREMEYIEKKEEKEKEKLEDLQEEIKETQRKKKGTRNPVKKLANALGLTFIQLILILGVIIGGLVALVLFLMM